MGVGSLALSMVILVFVVVMNFLYQILNYREAGDDLLSNPEFFQLRLVCHGLLPQNRKVATTASSEDSSNSSSSEIL